MQLELPSKLFLVTIAGISLRLLLLLSSYREEISNRVEISTPVSSWKRAIEGVYLFGKNISPYDGDTFHEIPMFLMLYRLMLTKLTTIIPYLFIGIDLCTAYLLGLSTYLQINQISKSEKSKLSKLKDADKSLLQIEKNAVGSLAIRVSAIYLLSPYSILACSGQSTAVFDNFITSLLLVVSARGHRLVACALVALLTAKSLYPLTLLFPVILMIEHRRASQPKNIDYSSSSFWISSCLSITLFSIFLSSYLTFCYYIASENWSFLSATYGFLLTVPELTPNIGLFWYFFTEMFDHFRTFFLWTFQINAFMYSVPLAITLRNQPQLLFFVILILLSLLKPYPSIADLAIFLALLPQWTHLASFMKQGLIIGGILITTSVLAPIMWHMWILMGTANSNFYFAVTLAYNTAQIFLVTDLLFAYTKRDFYLNNGIELDKDGHPARLELIH